MATIHGEVDTSVVPGTTHLVDLHGAMNTNHDQTHKDIVLIPTPSADPDDPLNWSSGRKRLHMFCLFMYIFIIQFLKPLTTDIFKSYCTFVGIASAALYSVLVPISLDTGLSLNDLNAGTGYMFLFFGWGCLIWQPLALQYGKRPVYLFSMIATLVSSYTCDFKCKTYENLSRQFRCGLHTPLLTASGLQTRSCKASLDPQLNPCVRYLLLIL